MNKISKHVLCLRQINLFPATILKNYDVQKYALCTNNLPLFNCISSFKVIRKVSTTSQTNLSSLVDTNDVLLSNIRTANQTSDVLEILRLHNSVMNASQHLHALNTLFILQKNQKTNQSNEELTRRPEFTALCHKIQNNSRNLDLNDLMSSVKCLSYLGVSVNSNIMQMQLQLISKMINDMSLKQITFLHFLLKDLLPCPLVDALKLALPIVFETQIKYKLDDNIFWHLDYLNYITKHGMSQKTFDFLVSKIISNVDQLHPKCIKTLLLNLYHKDYSTDNYINIINKCLNIYLDRVEYISNISEIEALLNRMILKYHTESESFYNEQYINKLVDYLIIKQENAYNILFIMKKFNRIGYVHCGLLDYVTKQFTNDHSILENSKFGVLITYIAACANGNYVPPGFNELKPLILKRLALQKDVLELPWLMVTFDLAVLNCWSEDLMKQVFSRHFLHAFFKRDDNIHDYIMLLKLYQVTITLYPGGYKGELPPKDIIEKAIDVYYQYFNNFPLKAALEHGLGGSDYVLTGVRSKLGHFIDHVVIMRPGGYSVSIKNEIKSDKSSPFIEDLVESTDNLVIGILLNPPNRHVINLNCLRGPFVLTNSSIEALGVVLLPISMDVWDALLDYEKIPYIMRELKSKTDLDSVTKNNMI